MRADFRKSYLVLSMILTFWECNGVAAIAAPKETLTVVNVNDAGTLDPIYIRDAAAATLCANLYDNLVKMDTAGGILPSLAESWEKLSAREYVFHLRRDVVFHNGEKFTARDVQYSIERALSPEGVGVRMFTQNVESVRSLDAETVLIRLKAPDEAFLQKLSSIPFCIVSSKSIEGTGEKHLSEPVGTGPFRLVSWSKGDRIILERNEAYWGKKPAFKTLIHRAVPETASRTFELESGAADIALSIGRNDIARIAAHPKLNLSRHLLTANTFIGMNTQKPPFDNPKVRKALWLALDMEGMYNAVAGGIGQPATGMLPSTVNYFVPFREQHKKDTQQARKLLKEAGWDKGLKVELWTSENKEHIDFMTIVQSDLAEVGIEAELKVLEMGVYVSAMQRGEHQIFIFSRSFPLPDPDIFLTSSFSSSALKGMNYCRFSDPEIDKLLEEARIEQNAEKRAQLYEGIQNRLEDQVAWIPVYTLEQVAGTQANVRNFVLDTRSYYYFGDVFIEDKK